MTFFSADVLRGQGYELRAITTAVIGGSLLTGGYGSVAGTALGALALGMAQIGHRLRRHQRRLVPDRAGHAAAGRRRPQQLDPAPLRRPPLSEETDEMQTDTPAPAGRATPPPLLEARDVSKYFGAVVAIEGVSLEVRAGQINCLLGDNGAGKSTLIKMLSGVHAPGRGHARRRRPAGRASARPATRSTPGIATVYQDLSVMPLMSISRNFFLGNEPTKGFGPFKRFDSDKAARIAREEMKNIGIDVRDTDQLVGTLSGGERQTLAIARAEYFGARVLILDEPTSALGVKESAIVLRHVISARNRGPRGHLHHPQRPARPADRRLVHDPVPRPVGRHVQARRARRRRAAPPDGRRRRARGAPGRPRDPRQARGARRGRPDRRRSARRTPATCSTKPTRCRRPLMTATIGDVAERAQRLDRDRQPRPGRASVGRGRRREARVLAAARELDYRPSGVARSLKRQTTETLGLIITDIENPFFPQLVRAVEDAARAEGYAILLCNAADDPEREAGYLELLVERRVDGLIIAASSLGGRHARVARRAAPPRRARQHRRRRTSTCRRSFRQPRRRPARGRSTCSTSAIAGSAT